MAREVRPILWPRTLRPSAIFVLTQAREMAYPSSIVMPGNRFEKCSTCTRDFSLSCSSAASWAMRLGDIMECCLSFEGRPGIHGIMRWAEACSFVEERMQVAVLGVVHLTGAFVDLDRHAYMLFPEYRCEPRLHLGQHRVSGFFL